MHEAPAIVGSGEGLISAALPAALPLQADRLFSRLELVCQARPSTAHEIMKQKNASTY